MSVRLSARKRRHSQKRQRTTRRLALEKMDSRVLLAADVFTSELGASVTVDDQGGRQCDPQGVPAIVAHAEGELIRDQFTHTETDERGGETPLTLQSSSAD